MKRLYAMIGGALLGAGCMDLNMPGKSFSGEKPAVSEGERDLAAALRGHVKVLSVDIGLRHVGERENLARAAEYLEKTLGGMGYEVKSQTWEVDGKAVRNLEVTVLGEKVPKQLVLMGAHYDSARTSPGADDNGSGVAALLELARMIKGQHGEKSVRLVFFTNEEPPFFAGPGMGSWQYAHMARERGDDIRAMIALDSIGRYSDEPGSQHYPAALASKFPDKGNFLAFVTRNEDAGLLKKSIAAFRAKTPVPSEGAALPGFIEGVGYSDHWSFWQFRYPAINLTDTAFFRWAEYHTPGDTMEQVDFVTLARVTRGLRDVLDNLAGVK